jgi:pimeloyl-ACP methyl ester carboxylesterase
MELFTLESGSPTRPAIVFLHGGGGGSWMWRDQLAALSDQFYCLAPDLPEHGQSSAVKPFSITGSAARTAELIRARVPGGRAHVVGLSEGAQIGVALLSQAPEVIERAILSSALLRPMPWLSWMFTPQMAGLSYDWGLTPFKHSEGYIRLNMKYAAGIPEEFYPQFKQAFQNYTRDSFIHGLVENQSFRLPDGLRQVQTPVLAVVGQKEYGAMRQSARDLRDILPNATGRMVNLGKKASLAQEHNWNMNAPDLFSRMVRAWVTAQELPAELLPLT